MGHGHTHEYNKDILCNVTKPIEQMLIRHGALFLNHKYNANNSRRNFPHTCSLYSLVVINVQRGHTVLILLTRFCVKWRLCFRSVLKLLRDFAARTDFGEEFHNLGPTIAGCFCEHGRHEVYFQKNEFLWISETFETCNHRPDYSEIYTLVWPV